MLPNVGYVIPSMGDREEYLREALKSIKASGVSHVVLVSPKVDYLSDLIDSGLISNWVEDPKKGITGAVNAGVRSLPDQIDYVGWIGDDDLIYPEAASLLSKKLTEHPASQLVFGYCDYIDPDGNVLFTNRVGKLALFLLRWGPNLLPQPSTMYRRRAFLEIGGLNENLKWACDLDLFIRLTALGNAELVSKRIAAFRWHSDSLTAGSRRKSVNEGSAVRKSHLPRFLRLISEFWELPVRALLMQAGKSVSRKSRLKSNGAQG